MTCEDVFEGSSFDLAVILPAAASSPLNYEMQFES